jgi:hypothetical protein
VAELYVDVDALTELSRQLKAVKESLRGAKDDVDAYRGRLGSETIEEALDDFVHDWKDGRKKIIEGIDGLLTRVDNAVEAYRQQEAALSKAARGGR